VLNYILGGRAKSAGIFTMTASPIVLLRPDAEELRLEIVRDLPNGQSWLETPHDLLGGVTPEQKIRAGELDDVRNLLYSILYIGIS
jgi:Protein of unknown function (DUF2384)